MEKKAKIYVNGMALKRHEFTGGGAVLRCGMNVEKMIAFLNEHKNARGYVNIQICEKRAPDEYGTHYAVLDTWEPRPRDGAAPTPDLPETPDDGKPLPF